MNIGILILTFYPEITYYTVLEKTGNGVVDIFELKLVKRDLVFPCQQQEQSAKPVAVIKGKSCFPTK